MPLVSRSNDDPTFQLDFRSTNLADLGSKPALKQGSNQVEHYSRITLQ